MPGGLMSLIATGQMNTHIPRNVAHEYIEYGPAQLTGQITLTRDADIIVPEYVKFSFVQPNQANPEIPITPNMLKTQLSKLSLHMEIGGCRVAHWPLAFLLNLSEPEIIDLDIYVNLHFDKIFGEINLLGLQHHEVRFCIVNNQTNPIELLTTWELVGVLTYLDNQERQVLGNPNTLHEEIIQYVYQMDVNVSNANLAQTGSEFKILLPFEGPNKGIFIECDNPTNIQEINLYLNGQERFRLNKFLIKSKCKIISSRMIYFPFSFNENYLDRSAQSFVGSTNYSRIDTVKLEVKFNPNAPTNQIKIFGLSANMYRQTSGMGGLAYMTGDAYTMRDLQTNYTPQPISSVQMYQISKVVFKLQGFKLIVDPDRKFCPISFEEIPTDTQYSTCTTCKNNYCVEILTTWLDKKQPNQRSCPMCKTKWTNWDSYINNLEPIANPNNPPAELAANTDTNSNSNPLITHLINSSANMTGFNDNNNISVIVSSSNKELVV